MAKLYSSRLYNKFFKITNDHIYNDYICDAMSKFSNIYFNGHVYEFFEDYIKYNGNCANIVAQFENYKKLGTGVTEQRMIIRYGIDEGMRRWNNYVQRQSLTNTFEYKQSKYNWTEDDFKTYNQSRAITETNLILKHGSDKAAIIWNRYREQQKYAGCSLQYFKDKFGEKDGYEFYIQLNKNKALTMNNFIRKYGEVIGQEKFNSYVLKQSIDNKRTSKISQDFFDTLLSNISNNNYENIFYGRKNYEYFFTNKAVNNIYFVDFYDISSNKVIEFYGDYYHCNPNKYTPEYFNSKVQMSALDIWNKDRDRIHNIEKYFGTNVHIVWENELKNFKERTLQQCLTFLNYDN